MVDGQGGYPIVELRGPRMQATSSQWVTFDLDGREVEAGPGESIWQAAKRHGIEIPHLCY